MTREEFRKMKFHAGMIARYKGEDYYVASVDFEEDLIGLDMEPANDEALLTWVRCESVELV